VERVAPLIFFVVIAVAVLVAHRISLAVVRHMVRRGPALIEKGAKSPLVASVEEAGTRALANHPRLRAMLSARLTPRRFAGLPLTLMVAAGVYILLLVGQILEELLEADELVALDQAVNRILESVRGWPTVDFFAWITVFGSSQTVIAVSLVMTAFLFALRRVPYIVPLWITVLGANATTWAGKYLIDRPRPEPVAGFFASSPSFPSGHATAAAAVYGFLAYLVARELREPRARFELVFWTTVIIGLVGFSRMYLGLHYLSDVATGFLVGGFWLLVGFIVAEHRRTQIRSASVDGSA